MTITEHNNNVHIQNYIIPKGMEKADLKTRENIVWTMLGKMAFSKFSEKKEK